MSEISIEREFGETRLIIERAGLAFSLRLTTREMRDLQDAVFDTAPRRGGLRRELCDARDYIALLEAQIAALQERAGTPGRLALCAFRGGVVDGWQRDLPCPLPDQQCIERNGAISWYDLTVTPEGHREYRVREEDAA